MAATKWRGRRRRRRKQDATETREAQLARIQASDNPANYPAIVEGFKARGIPVDDIKPRENVLTYRAWQAKGRQVRKGEKSVKIDVWIEYEKKSDGDAAPAGNASAANEAGGDGEKRIGRSRRSVAVFHISQTDPVAPGESLPETRPDGDKPDEDKPQPRTRDAGNASGDASGNASGTRPRKPARPRGPSSERLRELADNMETKIQSKLDPAIGRQNYTRRRAGIAAGMREDGYRLQRIQAARRKMADAIDAGTLPDCLAGVYSEADLGKLTSDYFARERGRESLSDDERDAADWLAGDDDMAQMKADRDAQRKRDARLRDIMANPPDGFFPTPKPLAARMVEMANIRNGDEILEPSAGIGHICGAISEHAHAAGIDVDVIAVECDAMLAAHLEETGQAVHRADILTVTGRVDRVVMNPPYERKQDLRHVRHCFGMLRDGGRLVALISAGFQHRADRETCDFREWLQSETIVDHCEILEDAFKGADSLRQTGVRVALLSLRKPGGPDA